MIGVAIIDDQTLVRQGIRRLLEVLPGIEVVAEAADGDEAIALLRRTAVDVALLDVRLPKKSGLEVLAVLGERAPRTLLLTTFDDDASALEGARLGARGFLLKDISADDLARAIAVVAAGGTLFNPAVTVQVARGVARLAGPDVSKLPPDRLSRREIEVLRWMAVGSSNREIAAQIGAAEGTVKNHASSIFLKLDVRDRTRAVLRAIQLGLL